LLRHGIKADAVAQRPDSETLAVSISELIQGDSQPVIIVFSRNDKDPAIKSLQGKFSSIIPLTVCVTSTAAWESHWKDELAADPPDFILFTEASEVEGFVGVLGDQKAIQLGEKSSVAAMDEIVAAALSAHGLNAQLQADASSADAFVEALIRFSKM
jgi:uroporphyrinogen-III synthase